MNLYKTTYDDDAVPSSRASWAKSATDASKGRTSLKKAGMTKITTAEVEVPTNKAGLLEWLNLNCVN